MNKNLNKLVVIIFIALAFFQLSSTQEHSIPQSIDNELDFAVNILHKPLAITKTTLLKAKNLTHLNPHYPASWVKEYISVEITAKHQGKIKSAVTQNDKLNEEQLNLMKQADVGSDISVVVNYIPNNSLKNKEAKKIDFSFMVEPETQAKYIEGEEALLKYLKEKAIDKIHNDVFKGYALAVLRFTIDEKGKIADAHMFESSKDEEIDKLLLETIRQMPHWQPAQYDNGTKVQQEFVLMVGNMESCVVNLLNIRRD